MRPDPGGATPELPVLGAYASVAVQIEAPATPASPPAAPAGAASGTGCAPDPAGVSATVIAAKGVLWQSTISAGGAPFPSSALEGIVTAVCPDAGEVLISADDIGESGGDLTIRVPSGIQAGKLEVGESVLANAKFEADGTLGLTGLASDEQIKGANDAGLTQGDLVAAKGGK